MPVGREEQEDVDISGDDSVEETAERTRQELGIRQKDKEGEVPTTSKEKRDSGRKNSKDAGNGKKGEKSKKRRTEDSDSDGKKGKKTKKKTRRDSSASSKSSDDSSEKDSSSSETDSSKDSEEDRKARKKSKKKRSFDKFDKLASIWRLERRPLWLQDRQEVNEMSWREIMEVKREHEREEQREEEDGGATSLRDVGIPTTKFEKAKDNRADKIHPASMLRLPIAKLERFWRKLPLKREPVFRNMPLRRALQGHVVPTSTLTKMHDRTVPVTLKMLLDQNSFRRPARDGGKDEPDLEPTARLRNALAALWAYTAIQRQLWPMDDTPEILGLVLVKCDYGGAQRSDSVKAAIIENTFNRVMVENAQRALERLPPVDGERMKRLLEEVLEQAFRPYSGGDAGGSFNNRGGQNRQVTKHTWTWGRWGS